MRDSRVASTDQDAGAVAALFRDHHGDLVRLALLMVGDLPTAEDVVQDVYASLHRRRSTALRASADRVRDDRLRPLPAAEPGTDRETGPRKAWRGWLVPVAAAVSVALVIGLALAVTGGASWRAASGRPAGRGSASVGVPRYFAQFTPAISSVLTLEVRSTSTGAVVASALSPQAPGWR